MYQGIYMELSNSEELKKSYLETEDKHSKDLNKIKEMLSLKDLEKFDLEKGKKFIIRCST